MSSFLHLDGRGLGFLAATLLLTKGHHPLTVLVVEMVAGARYWG